MDNKKRIKNRHILIVDDEKDIADLLKTIAEEDGFTVSIAVNGHEAFSMIAANRELYSCVIMDLNLPGMNGEKIIKNLERLGSDTSIIICSGFIDKDVFARLNKFEMVVSCHQKPVPVTVIRSILANISMRGEIRKARV